MISYLPSDIQKYIDDQKEMYTNLITFLDNSDANEKDFHNLIDNIDKEQNESGRNKIEQFF